MPTPDLGTIKRHLRLALEGEGGGSMTVSLADLRVMLAALERIPELEQELVQCSDELGSTRMSLNDEMYSHETTRQRSKRVETAAQELDIGCERPVPVLAEDGIDQEWADCGTCPACHLGAALAAAPAPGEVKCDAE